MCVEQELHRSPRKSSSISSLNLVHYSDLWRRKLAQGAGAIDLGDAGVESSMVYWADVLYERPDPDLAAFESGAGVGVAKSPEGHRWGSFPKARFAPDLPLEGAVISELVSSANSLLVRENTGNFIDFGLDHPNLSPKRPF